MPLYSSRRGSDAAKNLVEFVVGGVHYAVDIFRVREIVKPLELVPVPNAPAPVVGVADHRGEVVPVMELRRQFGVAGPIDASRAKWLIVDVGERNVGLIVDGVTEVFGVPSGEVRSAPDLLRDRSTRLFSGVCTNAGHLVFILDLDRLVSEDQAEVLAQLPTELPGS